jgi:hypothetical protein
VTAAETKLVVEALVAYRLSVADRILGGESSLTFVSPKAAADWLTALEWKTKRAVMSAK